MNDIRRSAKARTASSPPVSARNRSACDGQVVVRLVEAVATGVGDREHLGRTAAAAGGAGGAWVARLDGPLGHQVVEMAAYGGRRQVEPGGQRRRGRGPLLEDRPGHPLTGRLVGLEFHNASVPLLF